MEGANYFEHTCDFRNDPKIKALRYQHGIEGYAIWLMLLEMIHSKEELTIPYDNLTMHIIAFDMQVDHLKLQSVVNCLHELNLIEKIGKQIKVALPF